MVQASTYSKLILVTCAIGLGLSGYSFVVKLKKSQDAKYQSLCDFSEEMSCSRVLTSEYARGFGVVESILGEDSPLNVANSLYGGALFTVLAALSVINKAWAAKIQVGLGIAANLFTPYFAILLFYVFKNFCLLCVSTWAVNFINLGLSYLRLRALTPKQAGKQKAQQKSQKGQKKQQQNDKQKSPQAEKKKSEKQKSPQAEKQKQNQNQNQNQQKQNQNQNQQKQNQNQNQQKQNQNQKEQKQNQNQNQQKQNQNQQNKNQQNQQNGKVKNQQNDKQKSPKTPNSKKKNN